MGGCACEEKAAMKSNEKSGDNNTFKINSQIAKIGVEWTQKSQLEQNLNQRLLEIAGDLIPNLGVNWNINSLLLLHRQTISRVLYYDALYRKIIGVPGIICEFGVLWGATLSQLMAFRSIYEPYNHSRKIYGFDTFEGFTSIDDKDGNLNSQGDYSVKPEHFELLNEILAIHEENSPLPHIKKYKLIKGDVSLTIGPWLETNPHAIISMAIFDMDIYKPTKDVLKAILPRLTKGSLLVFDELNSDIFPGETRALAEVIGIGNLRLQRNPNAPNCAWAIWE